MHMANLTFATWKTCLLPALASGLHSLANRIIHYHIQWGKFFLAKTKLANHPTKSIPVLGSIVEAPDDEVEALYYKQSHL